MAEKNIARLRNGLQIDGREETRGGQTITVNIQDSNGDALHCSGLVVPSDSESGFAKGCLFIDTNVGAGTTGLYVNVGTNTACNFDAVSDA